VHPLVAVGVIEMPMSVAGLSRATMSAAISRNDAIAFAEEKKASVGPNHPLIAASRD
jgi:hypothetical protein